MDGIGPAVALRFERAGISTTADLLERCRDLAGRREVAAETKLRQARLLKWVNMADLMRISGVGGEYAELLEAAGVNTVKDLRRRNAENLTTKIRVTNERLKRIRVPPTEKMVANWVEQAKTLPLYVTY